MNVEQTKNEIEFVNEEIAEHTIKKFEIISSYIYCWAFKLLQGTKCNKLVYIDCMSNSGIYQTKNKQIVKGSAIRVIEKLAKVSNLYPHIEIEICLNDINTNKINTLNEQISKIDIGHLKVSVKNMDASKFLNSYKDKISGKGTHYFLLYDPYDASIDWAALSPFLGNWGEILINHMVSDTVRAVKQVKDDTKKEKYENTYLVNEIEDLLTYGTDRKKYQERINDIIKDISSVKWRNTYISSFPIFNKKNAVVYNLVHCTPNIAGKILFKKIAWNTFGGQSSNKRIYDGYQYKIGGYPELTIVPNTVDDCYRVSDIAEYLNNTFKGNTVSKEKIREVLNNHPIFPSDGYIKLIYNELKLVYKVKITQKEISFESF